MSYHARVVIDAAPDVVFPYLHEPDRLRSWLEGFVESLAPTPGPLRVGSRSTDVFTERGRRIEMQTEVTALEPDRVLAVNVNNAMVFTENRYTLSPEGAATVVELEMKGRFKGFLRLLAPFVGGMMRRRLASDLARLKAAVEAGGAVIADSLVRVLVHVQTHLDADLRLGALARIAGLSPFHFEREFTRVVGETVKSYTTRLRLERAAVSLLLQRGRVVDVALECGFRNHETFSRAFKRHHGVTPTRYREVGLAPPGRRAPDPPPARAASSLSTTTLRELEPIHVAFLRHVGPYEEVDDRLWDELVAWARRRAMRGPHVLLGIGHDAPGITPPALLRFDAALRVPGPFGARGRVGHQVLPGGLFSRTTHAGPLTTLPAAYPEIFGRLAGRKDLTIVGLPCIEVYHSQLVRPDCALNHTDLYVPVTARPLKR